MPNIKKHYNIIAIVMLLIMLSVCFVSFPTSSAFAATLEENGTYEAPIKMNIRMGADNFSDKVLIEKEGENYYLTFTIVKPNALSNLELKLNGKAGVIIREEDGVRKHTYTISKQNLQKELFFNVVVNQMNKKVGFSIEIKTDKIKKISNNVEDLGDRPAEFMPEISTTANNVEVEKGSIYVVPNATAKLVGEDIPVEVSAYYLKDGEKEFVQIKGNKIKLDKAGEYHVLYQAVTDKYITSYGNKARASINITITSKIGASVLAKLNDENNTLPKDTVIQASIVDKGDIFSKAQEKMSNIADNYQIFNIGLFMPTGEQLTLTEPVSIRLRIDDTFDRQNIVVYLLGEDGNLTECSAEGYGRYVNISTDKTGVFIICKPGVKFVMPVWGYAIIAVVCVVVVITIIIVSIVVVKNKKKKEAIKNGTYVEKEKRRK